MCVISNKLCRVCSRCAYGLFSMRVGPPLPARWGLMLYSLSGNVSVTVNACKLDVSELEYQ